jgi:hypothetical protein
MSTVGEPGGMTVLGGPVQVAMPLTVAAGRPPISTVGTPGGSNGPPTCGTVPVSAGQMCWSPTLAAGWAIS